MIAFLVARIAALGASHRVAKALAWVAMVVACIALVAALTAIYNNFVIDRNDAKREVKATGARESSAAERLSDTLENVMADKARVEVIEKAADVEKAKPIDERAKLPPTTKALNCQILREYYTPEELAKSDAYRMNCKG